MIVLSSQSLGLRKFKDCYGVHKERTLKLVKLLGGLKLKLRLKKDKGCKWLKCDDN